MNENVEYGYYDDTLILPTIGISGLNRREVKNLARTIAGRSNPHYGVTYDEVLNDKVNINSKSSKQYDRFKRLVKKLYDKNVLHTQQLERAKRAKLGDVKAMQDYVTTGTNKVAPYIAPLLSIPAVSVLTGTGVIAPALKHTFKVMANPATAKTTTGAMAATGLDAFGVAAGTRGSSDILFNRWLKGKFKWSDIPELALNTADMIPGAVAINATIGSALDMKRVRDAVKYINEAVSDINTPAARVGSDLDLDAPTNTPVEVSPTGRRTPTDVDPNNIIATRIPSQESPSISQLSTLVEYTAPTQTPVPPPAPTPPQFTIDLNGLLLSRLDVERLLRDAGYDQNMVSEALLDFDRAEISNNLYDFYSSPTIRRLARSLVGIRATDIESIDGGVHSVEDMIDILRREGLNELAIERRILDATQNVYPINVGYAEPWELTDERLIDYVNNLDESSLLYNYIRYLTKLRNVGRGFGDGRYYLVSRNLNNGDQRVFDAMARKLSLDYSMDFSDLSDDGYVKIKRFLKDKDYTSGDIEHMNWFHMRNSLPKDATGRVLITEADGTVRPIKYGERPQFSDVGRHLAGRQALQMFNDVPRGHAVAETNTSIDSELLKLNGALRRYGFGPGQFSVELASSLPDGNNFQFERMYMRDMLYYRDLLPDNEKVLLDKILDGKYGTEVSWEDLQGTGLLDLLRYEYLDLTNKLIKRLSAPWEKIKTIDSRPEIQKAPMPSYTGDVDFDLKLLLKDGNFSPHITRLPTYIFKNAKGGLIGKTLNLIGCNNPILKS